MTALTQYLSDLPGREDGEKVGDARSSCEHCQLAFVQLSNVIERHIRCWAKAAMARSCLALSCGGVDEKSLYIRRFLKMRRSHSGWYVSPCCILLMGQCAKNVGYYFS